MDGVFMEPCIPGVVATRVNFAAQLQLIQSDTSSISRALTFSYE
jgi:hypothetical protein